MTKTQALRDWRTFLALSVAATLFCYLVSGPKGALGMACGIVGASFNLGALWWIIGLGSKTTGTKQGERLGTILIVLAFFVKLPVFIGLGILCGRIGQPSFNCFLIAIGLVYSAVIGLALASR